MPSVLTRTYHGWSVTPTSIPAAEFNNPQSLNLYAYVRNNPIMKIDPDGHDVQVDDDAALKRIKSTLPKKVQEAEHHAHRGQSS